jgi:hypothetical protein
MPKSIWIFQHRREVVAKGEAGATWYCGWYDVSGKRHSESCGKGSAGRNRAEKRQRRLQAELDMGVYRAPTKTQWKEFVEQFERDVLPGLEPTTRRAYRESLKKFDRFTQKIGHPDKFRDYAGLVIKRDDYLGNVQRANEFESRRQAARIGKPVDRTEWEMTPQTVNAYYNPPNNEVCVFV